MKEIFRTERATIGTEDGTLVINEKAIYYRQEHTEVMVTEENGLYTVTARPVNNELFHDLFGDTMVYERVDEVEEEYLEDYKSWPWSKKRKRVIMGWVKLKAQLPIVTRLTTNILIIRKDG